MRTIDESEPFSIARSRTLAQLAQIVRTGLRSLMAWRTKPANRSVEDLSPDLWQDIVSAEDLTHLQSRASRQDRLLAQAKQDASFRALGLKAWGDLKGPPRRL